MLELPGPAGHLQLIFPAQTILFVLQGEPGPPCAQQAPLPAWRGGTSRPPSQKSSSPVSRDQVQLSTHSRSGVPGRLWSITHPWPAPHTDPTPQSWLLTHKKIPILFLWNTQIIFFFLSTTRDHSELNDGNEVLVDSEKKKNPRDLSWGAHGGNVTVTTPITHPSHG